MNYEEVVEEARKLVSKADASGIQDHLAVQFNVTGEGEGKFYLELKDGKVSVEPFDYNDRDILVTADAKSILDMMSGKLDIVNAYFTHKISAEGNLGKADLLKKLISSAKVVEATPLAKVFSNKKSKFRRRR
jgi:putative sterol carrier protein